jgi:hypothetical protein
VTEFIAEIMFVRSRAPRQMTGYQSNRVYIICSFEILVFKLRLKMETGRQLSSISRCFYSTINEAT